MSNYIRYKTIGVITYQCHNLNYTMSLKGTLEYHDKYIWNWRFSPTVVFILWHLLWRLTLLMNAAYWASIHCNHMEDSYCIFVCGCDLSWWRHHMDIFSALQAICAGNSPVPGEFPAQRPVTRSFDVFFDLRLNKRLSKQSRGWWFET